MDNNRILHIDNAKAFGIMLIIVSHISVSKEFGQTAFYQLWDNILNSFYVPMFFILSGIFESNKPGWKKFSMRLLKLFKYIAIFWVFGIISAGVIKGDWSLGHATTKTVIWFLFTLAWITIIMGCIKNIKYNYLLVMIFAIAGCWLSHHEKSILYLGQSMLCLPFYAFGYYFKDFLKSKNFHWQRATFFFAGWLILFLLFYSEQNISLNYVTQNYLSFYAIAILGSLFLIEFCKLVDCKLIAYYGKNSIVPMLVQFSFVWLILKFWKISTILEYFLAALLICVLCGLMIPVFRNSRYDLFK